MPVRPVRTTLPVDSTQVHLFQVVREHRGSSDEDWIVVGFSDGRVDLASADFGWFRAVPFSAFDDGSMEPVYAGDVPVWGY